MNYELLKAGTPCECDAGSGDKMQKDDNIVLSKR